MESTGHRRERELPSLPSDTISNVTFAKTHNNLLASSWDGSLKLYDIDEN